MRKDQEGDAKAAFSLYRKALEYFVPALHCESPPGVMWGLGVFLGGQHLRAGQFSAHPPLCLVVFPLR